jgi:hypothetical protein
MDRMRQADAERRAFNSDLIAEQEMTRGVLSGDDRCSLTRYQGGVICGELGCYLK